MYNSGCAEFTDRRRTAGLEGLRQRQLQQRDDKIKSLEEELKKLRHLAGGNKHSCGMVALHPECKAIHIQMRTQTHGTAQVIAAATPPTHTHSTLTALTHRCGTLSQVEFGNG